MRAVRLLLLLLGLSTAAYGGWLLWPQLATVGPWLVAGPLLHDALAAPLVGLVGLASVRLVPDPIRRAWITAGLVTTATLLLIAVPLIWRPAPAPANPGLQERNYPLELAGGLAVIWTVIMIVLIVARAHDADQHGRPRLAGDRADGAGSGQLTGHRADTPARTDR